MAPAPGARRRTACVCLGANNRLRSRSKTTTKTGKSNQTSKTAMQPLRAASPFYLVQPINQAATCQDLVKLLGQHLAAQTLAQTADCCRLLALACRRRLFVRLTFAKFGDQAVLFDGPAKATDRNVERLVFFQNNSGHGSPKSLIRFSDCAAKRNPKATPRAGTPIVHSTTVDTSKAATEAGKERGGISPPITACAVCQKRNSALRAARRRLKIAAPSGKNLDSGEMLPDRCPVANPAAPICGVGDGATP